MDPQKNRVRYHLKRERTSNTIRVLRNYVCLKKSLVYLSVTIRESGQYGDLKILVILRAEKERYN